MSSGHDGEHFEPCRFGSRVSTCYHVPRCEHLIAGDWSSPLGRWTAGARLDVQHVVFSTMTLAVEFGPATWDDCEQWVRQCTWIGLQPRYVIWPAS